MALHEPYPAITNATVTVANNCQRCEAKNSSAFYNFGNPVYLNQFFLDAFFVVLVVIRHLFSPKTYRLELQTGLHEQHPPVL